MNGVPSKLTDENVREIILADEPDAVLAARYGVSRTYIVRTRRQMTKRAAILGLAEGLPPRLHNPARPLRLHKMRRRRRRSFGPIIGRDPMPGELAYIRRLLDGEE